MMLVFVVSPILFFANSILIPPRSDENRTYPCSAFIEFAAYRTSFRHEAVSPAGHGSSETHRVFDEHDRSSSLIVHPETTEAREAGNEWFRRHPDSRSQGSPAECFFQLLLGHELAQVRDKQCGTRRRRSSGRGARAGRTAHRRTRSHHVRRLNLGVHRLHHRCVAHRHGQLLREGTSVRRVSGRETDVPAAAEMGGVRIGGLR